MKIFEYELLDSTSTEARRYAQGASEVDAFPAVFIAKEQSAGRGRLGRSFFSPKNTGLYTSLVFEAPTERELFLSLTSIAAVCTMEAIYDAFDIKTEIKWVNDLYLCGKKVAGILAESFVIGERTFVILGIGINLSTEDFPAELTQAGSLGACAELSDSARRALAIDLFTRFLNTSTDDLSLVMKKYRESSYVLGKRISFSSGGEKTDAVAIDINDGGGLVVRLDSDEILTLSSGEISVFVN